MIECVRRSARNVKRWQSGDMALRWTAAGMLEAERHFRRIIGYADLAKLSVAIERDLDHHRQPTVAQTPTEEAVIVATADRHTPPAVAMFHDERDILVAIVVSAQAPSF